MSAVPDTPEQFYARIVAAADADGRPPPPVQSEWDIFPFELEGLRTRRIEPPVLPEPPRGGEGGVDCRRCTKGDSDAVWSDDAWVLTGFGEPLGLPVAAVLSPRAHHDLGDLDDDLAADLGQLTVRIERAITGLGHIGRVHVNKWGDGGAHLHVVFLARPAGLLQLRGSNLALWEEMLPRVPDEIAVADLRAVAATLAAWRGRAHA